MTTRGDQVNQDTGEREREDQPLLETPKITDPDAAAKKKKKICIAVVVFLIVVGVALAIILPIALSKGGGDDQPTDPNVQEFNPYTLTKSNTTTNYMATGVISKTGGGSVLSSSLNDPEPEPEPTPYLEDVYYKAVNPKRIINNEYNKWASSIEYTISMNSKQQVHLNFEDKTNANKGRVPDSVLKRPAESEEARLAQWGFKINS